QYLNVLARPRTQRGDVFAAAATRAVGDARLSAAARLAWDIDQPSSSLPLPLQPAVVEEAVHQVAERHQKDEEGRRLEGGPSRGGPGAAERHGLGEPEQPDRKDQRPLYRPPPGGRRRLAATAGRLPLRLGLRPRFGLVVLIQPTASLGPLVAPALLFLGGHRAAESTVYIELSRSASDSASSIRPARSALSTWSSSARASARRGEKQSRSSKTRRARSEGVAGSATDAICPCCARASSAAAASG